MKAEINEMAAAYDFGNLNYEGNVKDNCYGSCDRCDDCDHCDRCDDCDCDNCDCDADID